MTSISSTYPSEWHVETENDGISTLRTMGVTKAHLDEIKRQLDQTTVGVVTIEKHGWSTIGAILKKDWNGWAPGVYVYNAAQYVGERGCDGITWYAHLHLAQHAVIEQTAQDA